MTTATATVDGGGAWTSARRRAAALGAMTLAIVVAAAALALYFLVGASDLAYWILAGVLGLALVGVLALFALPPPAPAPAAEASSAGIGPAGPIVAGASITLRCGDCGTVFDIPDTGERPLQHVCPGCGAVGFLRDAAPAATPSVPEAAPFAAAPTPSAVRRLKLRCGGCKEVFVIEDTGERPLRRPCPHCGRIGEVR